MSLAAKLAVRWTIGDVSARGFEALRLSLWGAFGLIGPEAAYAVCVNGISPAEARARTGRVPEAVEWHDATGRLPPFLARRLGPTMAEGVGWKLAPLRLFPDRHELSLDNDCILWDLPDALRAWLDGGPRTCALAEDVRPAFGQFADLCPPAPRNSGIRALPAGYDLASPLERVLDATEARLGRPLVMTSELDEQGLQVAALSASAELLVVRTDEVSICSPFWPHQPELGRCGAHFVGVNARHIPWRYGDRAADDCMAEHWARHRPALYARTSAPGADG